MTSNATAGGRYIICPMLNGRQVDEPHHGFNDLADALFRVCDMADDAPRSSSWIIRDRIDDADIVHVGAETRITYLA